MTQTSCGGDDEDRRMFDAWLQQNSFLRQAYSNADELWEDAKRNVQADLSEPDSAVRTQIPDAVAEIKLECFVGA
jgi:uncharacterized membrane-anchored protein YjiN (DUF445 family)